MTTTFGIATVMKLMLLMILLAMVVGYLKVTAVSWLVIRAALNRPTKLGMSCLVSYKHKLKHLTTLEKRRMHCLFSPAAAAAVANPDEAVDVDDNDVLEKCSTQHNFNL